MFPFNFIFTHFWLIAVVFTVIGIVYDLIAQKKALNEAKEEPKKELKLKVLSALIMVAPWLVMGYGIVVGGVPSMLHYFRPQDGNLYVLAWWLSIVLVWLFGLFWMLAGDGEETIERYFALPIQPLFGIWNVGPKWTYLSSIFVVLLPFIFCWVIDIPIEEFSFLFE